MKNFIAIFREPDGREDAHNENELHAHRANWKAWMEKYGKAGNLAGGSSLTLNGKLITGRDAVVSNRIHHVGKEIIGGFLLIKANDLEEATAIIQSCPIFEFDGYAEVREFNIM